MATGSQARRAADLHADQLASYPNVVGVGTRRIDSDPTAAEADRYAVAVYVTRKVPADQLDGRQLLPDHVEIVEGGDVARVPVIVVASGAFEPEDTESPEPHGGFTTE